MQSMHAGIQSVCSIHDFPYNKRSKKSLLQAAATIRERLMCRHAVAKVRLLFESGFQTILYGGMLSYV